MNYEEALDALQQLNKAGIHPGLEGIDALCSALNHPELTLKYVHVAGTNGKGSTGLFLSEILRFAGYKVGRYQSPAVFSETEIISVNGRNIFKADYARLAEQVLEINTMGATRFETETAMAFLYFAQKECDIVIMEAGMGGLLDATNIIPAPLASVFTSIGMDHTSFLGDTLEKIAENKAGIIKEGCAVITTKQQDFVLDILKKHADNHHAKWFLSTPDEAKQVRFLKDCTKFSYRDLKDLKISLFGTYQITNACLAIDAAFALKEKGFKVTPASVLKGLLHATEGGRMEKILDKPLFFLDGAHNEPAAYEFRKTIETYFTNRRILFIMGMFKDKDVKKVIELTADLAASIITVTSPNRTRALPAVELASMISPYNSMVTAADSIEEAVELSLMLSDKETVIVAFGSLSILDRVKKAVCQGKAKYSDTHGVG